MSIQTLPKPEPSQNCHGLGYVYHSITNWYQTGAIVALTAGKKAIIFHDCKQAEDLTEEEYFNRHWTIYINSDHYPAILHEWTPYLEEANCHPCTCSLAKRVCHIQGIPNAYSYEIPASTSAFSVTSLH